MTATRWQFAVVPQQFNIITVVAFIFHSFSLRKRLSLPQLSVLCAPSPNVPPLFHAHTHCSLHIVRFAASEYLADIDDCHTIAEYRHNDYNNENCPHTVGHISFKIVGPRRKYEIQCKCSSASVIRIEREINQLFVSRTWLRDGSLFAITSNWVQSLICDRFYSL